MSSVNASVVVAAAAAPVNVFQYDPSGLIVLQCAVASVIVSNLMGFTHTLNCLLNYRAYWNRLMSLKKVWARFLMVGLLLVPFFYMLSFGLLFTNIYDLNLVGALQRTLYAAAIIGSFIEFLLSFYVFVIFDADISNTFFGAGRATLLWLIVNIIQFAIAVGLHVDYVNNSGPGELATWAHASNTISEVVTFGAYVVIKFKYNKQSWFISMSEQFNQLLWAMFIYCASGCGVLAEVIFERKYGYLTPTFFLIVTYIFQQSQAHLIYILLQRFFPLTLPGPTHTHHVGSGIHTIAAQSTITLGATGSPVGVPSTITIAVGSGGGSPTGGTHTLGAGARQHSIKVVAVGPSPQHGTRSLSYQ